MEISKELKAYREANNLSQTDMAEKIGVSLAGYANWEHGDAEPQTENLKTINKLLGLAKSERQPARKRARFTGQKVRLYSVGEDTVAIDPASREAYVI